MIHAPYPDDGVLQEPVAHDRWTLAVFDGTHAGARVALLPRSWSLLGSSPDCDFVLRDAGVHAHHLVLAIEDERVTLRALEGTVAVDGKTLAPGATLDLHAAATFELAGVRFGIGREGSTEWAELQARCPVAAPPEAAAPALGETSGLGATEPSATPAPGRGWRALSRAQLWRATALGAAGTTIAAIGIAGVSSLSQRVQAQHNVAAIEQALAALSLPEVRLTHDANGHLMLEGVTASEAQRLQLASELAVRGQHPTLNVISGEQLAQSVHNSFRQRGLSVGVTYAGGGRVEVSGAAPTPHTEQVIREVLAGTASVRHVALLDAKAPPSPAAADGDAAPLAVEANEHKPAVDAAAERDPKRVVGVVGGEGGFVLTKDGTRYLPGATLPNGSQILEIQGYSVTFLRDGRRVQVDF
jgi:type III secretion system YscD/HrpQ family protein